MSRHPATPPPPPRVALEEEDVQRLWRGVQARRTRQEERLRLLPVRRMTAGALALALGLVALLVWRWPEAPGRDAGPVLTAERLEAPPTLEARAGAAPVAVPLSDGSRLTLQGGAKLEVLENSGRVFTTALRRGRTRFEVQPGGPRRWTVECGPVAVEVVGTVFAVERGAGSVVVEVEHGVVLVRGEGVPDRVRRLTAGERLTLALPASGETSRARSTPEDGLAALDAPGPATLGDPAEPAVVEPEVPAPVSLEQASARAEEAPARRVEPRGEPDSYRPGMRGTGAARPPRAGAGAPVPVPRPEGAPPCGAGLGAAPCLPDVASATGGLVPPPSEPWVEAARRGDLAGASARLGAAGLALEAERASGLERLMLLADVARAGDQAPLAARLLERAVREGGTGAPVALAAFQLGTLRLEALGQPREAAEAFGQVVRLGQPVALVEDALARQVQALARAGEREAARQLADVYAARYPDGRRLADVRRWAGE